MPTPTTYTYTVSPINIDQFTANIEATAIVTALDHVSAVGDEISILFKDVLSEGDELLLDAMVDAYVYAAPINPVQKVEVTTQPAVAISSAPEQLPFAQPTYRTKRDATNDLVTIAPGTSEVIDYQLTAERYVQGGQLLIENAKLGDYITAEVYDKDGIIPTPYRAALCEAWPSVAQYIVKEWISPAGDHIINTYPLNAKITAGLYLRVTYFATSDGESRKAAITYYLTKKL